MSLLLVPPWMDLAFKAIGVGFVSLVVAALAAFVAWVVS
jgi:hypothetical protein